MLYPKTVKGFVNPQNHGSQNIPQLLHFAIIENNQMPLGKYAILRQNSKRFR